MTVQYRCTPSEAGVTNTCTTTVSKSEFDALVSALDPNMPTSGRLSLASEYARLLIMAAEAQKRGIDQTQDFKMIVKFSTLQMLSAQLVKNITAHPAHQVSPQEIEQYLLAHQNDYQEVVFDRIVLPAVAGVRDQESSAENRAAGLQKRAAAGEDFAKLQAETTGQPANVAAAAGHIGPVRCLSLMENQRQICNLKPGEISPVIKDSSGLIIFRLVSRQALNVQKAQEEIRTNLNREDLQAELEKVRNPLSLKLDERYFGKLPAADVAHKHGMHMPTATVTDPTKTQEPHQHPEQ
jgi:parvulin-like peptidyl-prolyl isomerase